MGGGALRYWIKHKTEVPNFYTIVPLIAVAITGGNHVRYIKGYSFIDAAIAGGNLLMYIK